VKKDVIEFYLIGIKVNKEEERKFIEEVKELYSDFPVGRIEDSERPDFLTSTNDLITGIEIIRYYRKQNNNEINDREIEAIRQNICDKAQKIYNSKSQVPLYVYPLWGFRQKLNGQEISSIANNLATLVLLNTPEEVYKSIYLNYEKLLSSPLSAYCNRISIMKMQENVRWASVSASYLYVDKSEIKELIAKKNEKINDYQNKCDKIWLIIVFEGSKLSSTVDLHDVINKTFESNFEKILLYDKDKSVVHCLDIG
jgi:hypothetical protein